MKKDKLATAIHKSSEYTTVTRLYQINVLDLMTLGKNEVVTSISFDSSIDTVSIVTEENK
jgi:hypothetical protein